jgi:hypothetical protein
MNKDTVTTLRAFLIELVIYSILVVGYFFCVLHFLGEWLPQLHDRHRVIYAGVAILLILGQAVLLETVTSFILRMVHGRSE